MAGKTEITPLTDAALEELKVLHAGLHCSFGGIGGKIVDAFPQLIARLEAAELEREELREDNARLTWRIETMLQVLQQVDRNFRASGSFCDDDNYQTFLDHIKEAERDVRGGEDTRKQWLAARDARIKKLGAAEWLRSYLIGLFNMQPEEYKGAALKPLTDELARLEAAAQLRREGE